MFDFTGKALTKAGPSVPVQILGFNTLPAAGDFVMVAKDEREAAAEGGTAHCRLRQEQLAKSRGGASSLDEFYRRAQRRPGQGATLWSSRATLGGSVEALEGGAAEHHPPRGQGGSGVRGSRRHQRV